MTNLVALTYIATIGDSVYYKSGKRARYVIRRGDLSKPLKGGKFTGGFKVQRDAGEGCFFDINPWGKRFEPPKGNLDIDKEVAKWLRDNNLLAVDDKRHWLDSIIEEQAKIYGVSVDKFVKIGKVMAEICEGVSEADEEDTTWTPILGGEKWDKVESFNLKLANGAVGYGMSPEEVDFSATGAGKPVSYQIVKLKQRDRSNKTW